jgi:hypothetical protein
MPFQSISVCITASRQNLSALSCMALKKEEEITKPTTLGRAHFNQSGRTQNHHVSRFGGGGGCPLQSIKQLSPDNQVSDMPSTLPPLHSLGLLLPSFVCTADYLLCPTLSHLGKQGPTHPSTPFVYGILGFCLMASVQTFGNNAGDQTEVMIKRVFMAVRKLSRLWRKPHSKFSMFKCGKVEGCTHAVPACQPICLEKKIPGQLVLSLQPAMDMPHSSRTQPALHHLDIIVC